MVLEEESTNNNLLAKIQNIGSKLLKTGLKKGFTSEEVRNLSEDLKKNLNELNCLGNESKLNFQGINSIIYNEVSILITDIQGVIIYVNNKYSATLGYQADELIGKHTRIFKTGIHMERFYQDLWEKIHLGLVWKGELTSKRKDGYVVWNWMSIFPLFDDNNQLYGFLSLRVDITGQKEMKKQVLLQEKLSEIPSIETLGCIDQNGKIMYLIPVLKNILGYSPSERVGLSIFDNLNAESLSEFKIWFEKLKKKPESLDSIEVTFKSKNGELILCEFSAKNLLHDPAINGIVFIYRDLTKQKKLYYEIEKIEQFDVLTGLPNYRLLDECLRKEINFAKENNTILAIIQLDIDDFKYVNKFFSHSIGEQLLIDFSLRIKESFDKNAFLFRLGGDEFVILIKDIVDCEYISKTLAKVLAYINKKPFEIKGNELHVSVSMGVSMYPFSGENKEILLKNAETAMYKAKNNGKNQFQIFSPTMNLYSYKQFTLKNDAKKALEREEYCIYYQPRFNPKTDEMMSAEALIRWNHPRWGIVSPNEFIPIVEESGLIVKMGEWLLRKVCNQLKIWESEGLPIKKISINLSSLQLLQPHFADVVSSILKEFKVDSKWIEFEITETVIIQKEQQVLEVLNELRNLGITIALDDFGTGYSSLNYLRKFPCDIIKIDKSLIDDIHHDKDNYLIIESIINLCHKLQKFVVGEGVETKEQLSLLKVLMCDEIQGYFYSKPIEETKFEEFLKPGKWENIVKIENIHRIDRRKDFRILLKVPLLSEMTIVGMGINGLHIGNNQVFIKNIGPGGLYFLSTLKLPVKDDIILQFSTEIFYHELKLQGYIVWYKEIDNSYYGYGVKFLFNEMDKEKLIKILKRFQVKIRNNPILPGCRFDTM